MPVEDACSDLTRDAQVDLSAAVVVVPPDFSDPENRAVRMLVEEVEKRTRIRWKRVRMWPESESPVITVSRVCAHDHLAGPCEHDSPAATGSPAPEGYRLGVAQGQSAPAVFVEGNDARGVLFGVGHLLRSLRMTPGTVTLPADLNLTTSPRYRLRGHQLGYRDKTNSYCGWDLPEWEQYIRDLVVFGANAIELIPPRSDDNLDSVHFPLPPLEMMAGVSRIADDYGIDVWIWYPALDEDYGDPATVAFALREWGEVFEALPRIDAVFVPGGDPGQTQPVHLMSLLEKQRRQLQTYHPGAQMWVSPQGFTQEWLDELVTILEEESPDWLTGVVIGPQVHMTTAEFRALIPDRYPIRNYPDITHCFRCQYPVPDWDAAYALTVGREPVNPRPHSQAAIFSYSQPHTVGFLTYSEGCNDDVNKCIWSCLGWDPGRSVIDILREYSRYFIGEPFTDDFAQGLLALEQNWVGPLATNAGVATTLGRFQAMERSASPRDLKNWRFQQALFRAYYDTYTRSRLAYETSLEEQALGCLHGAPETGSLLALDDAERILAQAVSQPVYGELRTRVFQLAEALFQSIHMQLSVRLYGAQSEGRGANLDAIDFPLNDAPWLRERFSEIRQLDEEANRLEDVRTILQWTDPGPGGFYDNLGQPFDGLHVVPGLDHELDPAHLASPLCTHSPRKDLPALRRSWHSFTGSINDAPFQMRYTDLDPDARYRLRLVYTDLNPDVTVRLEANDGVEIHPPLLRPVPRAPLEFDVPQEATQGGQLTLTWYRAPGRGRNGLGCGMSEVWLMKRAEGAA